MAQRCALADALLEHETTFEALCALRKTNPRVFTYHEGISEVSMREILEIMQLKSKNTLLDFGCGAGRWLAVAHELCACRLIGIEYVQTRVRIAKQVLQETNAEIMQGDGLDDAIWRHQPSHVVFVNFDVFATIQFWKRVALEKSVVFVATWMPKPEQEARSFVLQATSMTMETTGERRMCYVYRRAHSDCR